MNPTFKQVTKTRYVQLVSELAQEIFVQHYTKLTPKVAAALADKYQSDILTDDEIHSGVINYFLIYLGTEPVGYFALDLGPAGAMCLSRLFLKEKARGQGIGRSIVAYAQKLAEGDGRSRLYMRVWARDLKAEGFAKKCRFRKAETAPWRSCPAPRWTSRPGRSCGGKSKIWRYTMKFLHLADLHLGKRVNGFDMLEDQRFILEQILTLCEKHGVEAVVIAGDIYDTPVPPAAACTLLDWFLTQLAARRIPVLAVSGNHDSAERLDFASSLLAEQNVHIAGRFTGCPKQVVLNDRHGPIEFTLLPFVRAATVRHYLPDADITDYDSARTTDN